MQFLLEFLLEFFSGMNKNEWNLKEVNSEMNEWKMKTVILQSIG